MVLYADVDDSVEDSVEDYRKLQHLMSATGSARHLCWQTLGGTTGFACCKGHFHLISEQVQKRRLLWFVIQYDVLSEKSWVYIVTFTDVL